ncbi:MAG: hypothetical protein ACK5EJ_02475, partial [Sphingomonadaceae bacterium]
MSPANPKFVPRAGDYRGQLWAPLLVAGAFLAPGHLFEWALEYLWLAAQLTALFVFLILNRTALQPIAGVAPMIWLYVFLAITISGIISAIYGYVALSIPPELADAFDLLRFAISIPLVIFIGNMIT